MRAASVSVDGAATGTLPEPDALPPARITKRKQSVTDADSEVVFLLQKVKGPHQSFLGRS